jgi:hypothetical protein
MPRCKLRTPWPIHFKLRIVIGIDSCMVCILFWWNFNFSFQSYGTLFIKLWAIFRMSRCKLRTPWPIHFKLRTVIGIDSLTVCILFGEISIFHSRVMGKNVFTNIVWMLTTGVSCALGAAVYLLTDDNIIFRLFVICTVGVQYNWILFNSVCEFHA